MRAPLLCVLLTLAIAACSGGGSAIPGLPSGGGSHANVTVKFKVIVPSVRHRGKHARSLSSKLKRIWSVAENTLGIQVVSYANGDRATPLGTVVADISPSSTNCSATSSYGGRTCTLDVQAPPGKDDFVTTTYDKVPVGGAIPGSAKQLGYGVATKTVTAGAATNVSLAIEGVLAKVELGLTPDTLHTLVPANATLNVYGLDADDDVIVGNGYIDANGNTITVGLSVNNPLPLGSPSPSPSPGLTLAQTSISAPQPGGVAVTYAPAGSGFAPAAATVTISASPSASSVTTTTAKLKAVAPVVNQIVITNLNQNNSLHGGMAFDNVTGSSSSTPDNVYFTGAGGFGSINECANCGSATQAISASVGTSTSPLRGGIAGNGSPSAGSSTMYAVAGTTAEFIGAGSAQTPFGVTAAPIPNGSQMIYDGTRGALWYVSGTNLVDYPQSGSGAVQTNGIGAATVGGLTLDSGDNVWIVDTVHNRIRECTGPALCNPSIALNGTVFDVVDETNLNGTERLIVTDHGNNTLIVLNAAGTVVNTLTLPSGASPYYIAPDNAQAGVVWFDYFYNGAIGIGRLDMNHSPPQVLMANGPVGVASSSAAPAPGAIGVSPAGFIYTAFDADATLVQWTR